MFSLDILLHFHTIETVPQPYGLIFLRFDNDTL